MSNFRDLRTTFGTRVTAGATVLVGFSQGALVIVDMLQRGAIKPGTIRGLVLVSATISIDPKWLTESGIQRIGIACGDFDGAAGAMSTTASKLAKRGFATRYLGKVGYFVPDNIAAPIGALIDWVRELCGNHIKVTRIGNSIRKQNLLCCLLNTIGIRCSRAFHSTPYQV